MVLSNRFIRNAGLGLLVLIILVMVASGTWQASHMEASLQKLEGVRARLEKADQLLNGFLDVRGQLSTQIIQEQYDLKALVTSIKQLQEQTARLEQGLEDPDLKQQVQAFAGQMSQFRTAAIAYLQEMRLGTGGEGIRTWGTTLIEVERAAHQAGNTFKSSLRQKIRDENAVILANAQRNRSLALVFGTLGVVLALAVTLLLHVSLSRPVRRLVAATEELAEGDLTVEVRESGRDELGQLGHAITGMADKLIGIVRQIQVTVTQVQQASGQLDRYSDEVLQGSDRQKQDIDQAADKIMELETIVIQVSGNLENLSRSLADSTGSAEQMSHSIGEVSRMTGQLAEAVDSISSSISQMNSALGQNLELVEYLAASATEMRSTAASLADMSAGVGEKAAASAQLTEQVSTLAREDGARALDEVVQRTGSNREQIFHYRELIHSLGEKSEGIGDILAVIRSVAEQTNLLALNAAIIAAQAGEHGRSFAVVADEIRKLSETTTGQIDQIEQVIGGVQVELATAVESIDQIIGGADASLQAVSGAREVLDHIVRRADESGECAAEIAAAARQQASGSRQIEEEIGRSADQVEEIRSMIAEQKRGGDQIVAATEDLRLIAEKLKTSTREQAEGSQVVSKGLSDILEFSRDIGQAMEQERQASQAMVQSLMQISGVAENNLKVMRSLGDCIDQMRSLAERLVPEVRRFRLPEEGV
ncbi:MAG: methyl-accepting chemotaxis protein [Deltaproteobacteria bacterium]|nr:MAG: methyl-accepting chemotaxis protein [Deltaproteobacteria bacterium]